MNLSKLKTLWPMLVLILVVGIFFKEMLAGGKLPIPSDTIIGLYHPFRDLYKEDYPSGIPFKNFLITDPIRQQYPWRELGTDVAKRFELPLWNPYAMAGHPLLGNMQAAVFYPFNILFLLIPFDLAWSLLIVLQPLLAGFFLYLYLRNLGLNKWASLFGGITFSFCGFSIAWLTWGTILQVGLWLPLMLLAMDKIFLSKKKLAWSAILIFSLCSSFFAGHLQTFFYAVLLSILYLLIRWWRYGRNTRTLLLFAGCYLLVVIITAVQWIPTSQLILQSAREVDQASWQQAGWFIPWQHLIQFVAPDFFGNPTTLNYWGIWNYGELVGYIGILPLLFALFAIFSRRDKKTLFFIGTLFVALLFSLPTSISSLPYIFHIPFLSTAQPTRLLFVVDFSLAVLAALGFDIFLRAKRKTMVYPIILVGLVFAVCWSIAVFLGKSMGISAENLLVIKSNLLLPTGLFIISTVTLLGFTIFSKRKLITLMICIIIVILTSFDLVRFGLKFTPFTDKNYLFPSTKVIEFLQKQDGQFRIMSADNRILPPNFSSVYRLQSVDGYDPLYLRRYGELIAASERGQPNIDPPFGFNRIITPHNYDSKIIDLLGVRYVLSLTDLSSGKLKKVFEEGQTRVYENTHVLPRVFFVKRTHKVAYLHNQEAIAIIMNKDIDLSKEAVVELPKGATAQKIPIADYGIGEAQVIEYGENEVKIKTKNDNDGFLILVDGFYPTWQATIDGNKTQIFKTDYNFRGVVIPAGKHDIFFTDKLF